MPLLKFGPFNLSKLSFSSKANKSEADLRPCQKAYIGESGLRRLQKRSELVRRATRDPDTSEPIFAAHQESTPAVPAQSNNESATRATGTGTGTGTGYSVSCYATHEEDELRRKAAEADDEEKLTLLKSINQTRHGEGQPPLRLKPFLCTLAQDYANMLYRDSQGQDDFHSHSFEKNSVVVVMSPSGSRVARIVSPPQIGALTCGEAWRSGKYRKHYFPSPHHTACACHVRMVFQTMVDSAWKAIGIGRGQDGRWVVELAQ